METGNTANIVTTRIIQGPLLPLFTQLIFYASTTLPH